MKYISLLRGINVSGQKKIKMAELKALYESLGLARVVTYIQSGNVLFDSDEADPVTVQHCLQAAIAERFGFDVPVLVRTSEELDEAIARCPFGDIDIETQGTQYLVTFLSHAPAPEHLERLQSYAHESESLVVRERLVYLHCPNGYGRSKLSNTLLERVLVVTGTSRNWKTLCKLNQLATND